MVLTRMVKLAGVGAVLSAGLLFVAPLTASADIAPIEDGSGGDVTCLYAGKSYSVGAEITNSAGQKQRCDNVNGSGRWTNV